MKKETYQGRTFDEMGPFREGYARVYSRGEGWNYIDRDGYLVSPDLWFDDCEAWDKGVGRVWIFGKLNYVDKHGELQFIAYDPSTGKRLEQCKKY